MAEKMTDSSRNSLSQTAQRFIERIHSQVVHYLEQFPDEESRLDQFVRLLQVGDKDIRKRSTM